MTIDINLSELKYLSSHLDPRECRRLVACLYRDNQKSENCINSLLEWNDYKKGETGHEILSRYLRFIGRRDLADWLAKTTFNELANDLRDSLGFQLETNKTTLTPSSRFAIFSITFFFSYLYLQSKHFYSQINLNSFFS